MPTRKKIVDMSIFPGVLVRIGVEKWFFSRLTSTVAWDLYAQNAAGYL